MGGSGSGSWYRWNKKTTTESQKRIDIRWMNKKGLLVSGMNGTLSWTCRGEKSGSIGYCLKNNRLVLDYRSRQNGGEWQNIVDEIFIEKTTCNYGGERKWFICPVCKRRVAVLYGGKYFRCRHCYNLTYECQQECIIGRLMGKAQKIRKRLGGSYDLSDEFPLKPKNMHWKTYWRLREESERAHYFSDLQMFQRFRLKL